MATSFKNINAFPVGDRNTERVNLNTDSKGGLDAGSQKPNQPYIVDLVTLEKLWLQTIPFEIEVDPNANWVALASMGRNLPGWQFTGAEDTIKFDITWYCDHSSREDVIKKCKWLQALSRPDGYDGEPHPLQFVFGDLFKDSKFIMYAAPYRLGQFNREYFMLPTYALQSITLKRISETNLKRIDFVKTGT